uniref:THAP domain-containing protein 1-like n=1 Tax=Crassostrea virginica TaxID=6565 RepID=A0A8B8AHB3_CRAVI|nr:THAP domain-containing protein 1-like [Crassostrea virginica]
MVFCAAYGFTNRKTKGCGLSFFSFPKDSARKKTWTVFGRREDFVPTKNHRLCSAHFSADQLARDPKNLEENGYAGARIRLIADAFPDIPLPHQHIQDKNKNGAINKTKRRGANEKRQRANVLQQVMLEFEARNCEDNCETSPPVKEHELDPTINQDMPKYHLESLTEEATCSQEETEEPTCVKQVEKKCQYSSLSDGIPLRFAAGLVPLMSPPPTPNFFESDSEEQDPVSDSDSDFDPMDEIDDASEDENNRSCML